MSFVTADQLVAHAIGDYIIQTDWMATEKTKRSLAALVHAITYTATFLFLTTSWQALLLICVTHFVIDRFRLARYLNFVKNWRPSQKWKDYNVTGYCNDRPPWLAVWLMIITDNIMHILINAAALRYLI